MMKKNLLSSLLTLYMVSGISTLAHAESEIPEGKQLFLSNCAACHQAEGQGIPGAFPALAENAFVAGEVENVIRVVLTGRGGMPSFGNDLSSQDMSRIIEYIREGLNSTSTQLDSSQIDALRTSTKKKMEREG